MNLREALWQCYVETGADTDGNDRFYCHDDEAAIITVQAVKQLRKDYEDALDEIEMPKPSMTPKQEQAAIRGAIAAIKKARNDPNTKWTPIKRADLKGDDWAARLEAQIDFEHSPEGKAHYQALFRGDVPRGGNHL